MLDTLSQERKSVAGELFSELPLSATIIPDAHNARIVFFRMKWSNKFGQKPKQWLHRSANYNARWADLSGTLARQESGHSGTQRSNDLAEMVERSLSRIQS